MPELPAVERGRCLAQDVGAGRVIQQTHCQRDAIVFQGLRGEQFAKALRGKLILQVRRWGKQLWFEMNAPPHPLFHFGMAGAFRTRHAPAVQLKSGPLVTDDAWPPRFTKIRLWLDDGGELVMTDARRFGRILLRDDPLHQSPIANLGFDPFLALPSLAVFGQSITARAVSIKTLLLDQRFCAGIGNWMADEILYQARIDPRRRGNTLSTAEIAVIRMKLKSIVGIAVSANAEDSLYPRSWLFHRRWGRPANAQTAAGESIEFIVIGGRTTAWVPAVQHLDHPYPTYGA